MNKKSITKKIIQENGILIIKIALNGEFNGFYDNAIFKLMNDDLWKQVSNLTISHFTNSPTIEIYQYEYSCFLILPNIDEFIQVEKIS